MIVIYGLIFFLLLTVLLLVFAILFDISFIGHDFATTRKAAETIGNIIYDYKKQESVCYDLGSSRGGLVLRLSRLCPQLKITGIDDRKFRTLISKLFAGILRSTATFVTADIFTRNFKDADVIYAYVGDWLMPKLEEKLLGELKPGCLVITNTQHFPSWQPKEIRITHNNNPEYEKLYIYRHE